MIVGYAAKDFALDARADLGGRLLEILSLSLEQPRLLPWLH